LSIQLIVIAVIAAAVTAPVVLFIPRVRQSPAFDRILWIATWLLSFAGGWYAVGNAGDASSVPGNLVFAEVPLLNAFVGAIAGALLLNAILWLMDRLAPPEILEHELEDASATVDEAEQ
jgi:hypothetical protein